MRRKGGREGGMEGGRERGRALSIPHAGKGAEASVGASHDTDVIPQVAVTEVVVDHCREGGRGWGRRGWQ